MLVGVSLAEFNPHSEVLRSLVAFLFERYAEYSRDSGHVIYQFVELNLMLGATVPILL